MNHMNRKVRTVCVMVALSWLTWPGVGIATELSRGARIEKSLKLLDASARVYTRERQCFSCHHQALPAMTFQLARQREISVAAGMIARQVKFTRDYYHKRKDSIRKGAGIPGSSYSAGYALLTLAAAASPADETRDAMVQYLHQKQTTAGHWRIGTHRPPLEDSHFTATALSLAAIQWADRRSSPEQLRQAMTRARAWLRLTRSETTEDRVFQLLGLSWAQPGFRGSNNPLARRLHDQWLPEDIPVAQALVSQLRLLQRIDGSWAQRATGASDAYATGQVLCCLYVVGGLDRQDLAFKKGIQYLEDQQQEDGSWRVKTRSKPIQTYFESGFPHGKSQFISIAASSWATMALLLSLEKKP
jgi:hypothetical protein